MSTTMVDQVQGGRLHPGEPSNSLVAMVDGSMDLWISMIIYVDLWISMIYGSMIYESAISIHLPDKRKSVEKSFLSNQQQSATIDR